MELIQKCEKMQGTATQWKWHRGPQESHRSLWPPKSVSDLGGRLSWNNCSTSKMKMLDLRAWISMSPSMFRSGFPSDKLQFLEDVSLEIPLLPAFVALWHLWLQKPNPTSWAVAHGELSRSSCLWAQSGQDQVTINSCWNSHPLFCPTCKEWVQGPCGVI